MSRTLPGWKMMFRSGLIGSPKVVAKAGWSVPCIAVNAWLLYESWIGFGFNIKTEKVPYFITKKEVDEIRKEILERGDKLVNFNTALVVLIPIHRLYPTIKEATDRVHNPRLKDTLL